MPFSGRMRRGGVIAVTFTLLVVYCDALYDVGRIECSDTLNFLNLKPGISEFAVECPHSCLKEFYSVVGSGPYRSSSNICSASIHNGTLTNSEGGRALVVSSYQHLSLLRGSERNGVKAKMWLSSTDYTFITKKLSQSNAYKMETSTTSNLMQSILASSTNMPPVSDDKKPTAHLLTTSSIVTLPVSDNARLTTVADYQELLDVTKANKVTTKSTEKIVKFRSTTIMEPYQSPRQREVTNVTTMQLEATTARYSHVKTTDAATLPTIVVEKHFLGLSSAAGKILLLIGLFLGGGCCTVIGFVISKKLKKKYRRTRGCRKNKNSRLPYEEGEFCVCYQNISSSKQGLLYDPETCDRPCPIRKPLHGDDVEISSMAKSSESGGIDSCNLGLGFLIPDETVNKSFKHEMKCKIRYEDDCADGCSGACSPAKYDF